MTNTLEFIPTDMTKTPTPRFVPVHHLERDGQIRFFVFDLNCLDTICECRGAPDAELIASILNEAGEKVGPRLKIDFEKLPGWARAT